MRKLTVIRNKSNTARFSSMRVFAEDEENGNINLYGVKCRLLGTLKNGASATYEISEKSAEILFVGSSFSWKHDLPEGEEDVVLEGEVVSISGVGRAFAVKGDESQIEEVSQRIRSKNTKRSTLIRVLAILLVCAAVGITLFRVFRKNKPKDFTFGELTVTLDESFRTVSVDAAHAPAIPEVYNSDYSMFVYEYPIIFYSGSGVETVRDFALNFIGSNSLECDGLKEENGLLYCEHEHYFEEYNDTQYYVSFFYKGNESFWMLDFSTHEPGAHRGEITERASTVRFAERAAIEAKDIIIEEFTITLNTGFELVSDEDDEYIYRDPDMVVYVYKMGPSGKEYGTDMMFPTMADYAQTIIEAWELECDGTEEKDGLTYCEYTYIYEDSSTLTFTSFFFKGEKNYWMVEFGTRSDGERRDEIFEYARSVRFSQAVAAIE